MPYVNVYLDVGAVMKACKLVWTHPQKFLYVFIQIGDFHFIKENFGFINKLVIGSRFEDAVFQAGVCSTGGLNGVLSGSHYSGVFAFLLHGSNEPRSGSSLSSIRK